MSYKRNINVCFTPSLFPLFDKKDSIIIVVDILRASSVICTAFHYGVKSVIPVKSLEDALLYKDKENYIIAGERNAQSVKGFNYGNSPFQYMNDEILGKTLVLSTTNGTKAINMANHHTVIIASYINFTAVINFMQKQNRNIIILCSGWKGFFNMEDSIFAGKLSHQLLNNTSYLETNCDSVLASQALYKQSKSNLFEYLKNSSHRLRLQHLNMEKDTRFCLSPSLKSSIVPILNGKELVELK